MKVLILACLLGVTVTAVPLEEATPPLTGDYHIDIGIPLAASIKASEEAMKKKMIGGGEEALLGKFPHFGGLLIALSTGENSYCGCSLISTTRAVTAAHCCLKRDKKVKQFTIVLGSITLHSGGTRVNTSDFVTHPDYNYGPRSRTDIAVLLFKAIEFTENIQPIALASGNNHFVDAWATAVGFGRYGADDRATSRMLHYVKLKVISNSACELGLYGSFPDSVLCTAGIGGKSVCRGDSGGPLETNVSGVRTLIGVVSFGKGSGCGKDIPNAYARITFFRSWLLSI